MDTGTTRESHRALTQLQVTHELREHQRAWFAEVRRSVIEERHLALLVLMPYGLPGSRIIAATAAP